MSQSLRWAVAVLIATVSGTLAVALTLRHPDALVTKLPSTDMRELHLDFDTFWHSAVAFTQGADIYDTPAKLTNLNPPLMTVLLSPFAALDVLVAYRVFVALSVLMVLGSVLVVARELRLGRPVTAVVVGCVLLSSPLHGTLVLGQIYPLLLVGLVAGWTAQRRGRPVLGAVLFGVTVALKPSLAPILLLPVLQRRWAPAWAGMGAAAAATAGGALLAGPSSAVEWVRIAIAEGVPDSVDNASLPGLAVRFGLSPVPGTVAGLLVLGATSVWCARHRGRVDPSGTAVWAVLAAGLLLSPIAWHNYLLLLFPGVLVLVAQRHHAAATAALAVTLVPVSWNAEFPPDGTVADIGRSLYCAVLLGYWLLLLRSAASPGSGSDERSSTPETVSARAA
ncbi:glycosyltransferase family 87 protein [Actinomycetes bacterium KLBMP 9759]